MEWKKLSKSEADNLMQCWEDIPTIDCSTEYDCVRSDLLEASRKTLEKLNIDNNDIKRHEYEFDLYFGIQLYEILSGKYGLSIRDASDDGCWRYLSNAAVPDIIFSRWGKNPGRFWKESRRIWLKTLWWYIFLSWQGSADNTLSVLKGNTTDEIVQLVERSGSYGYRVELYRQIIRYYGTLPDIKRKNNYRIFRRIMKLNTARLRVLEPALVQGGEKQYVKELFGYFEL